MAYDIKFTASARRDLEEIFAFIAANSGSLIAINVLDAIEKRCADLSELPNRGNVPKELAAINNRLYRELHYKPYRIIYKVTAKDVVVHCVADGRRNMDKFLQARLSRPD